MTDDLFTPPFAGADNDDDQDTSGLPAHEIDNDDAVGGGVMSSGGTSTDRGTGELTGDAQGSGDGDGEDDDDLRGAGDGIIPGMPSGGTQSYIPAMVNDDEDGGGLPSA